MNLPSPDTSALPSEVEHLRRRVRLYLLVMIVIDLSAYVSDYVMPLLVEGLAPPDLPLTTNLVRWGVTAGVSVGWLFMHFTRPPRVALIAAEASITVGLSLVYVHIASVYLVGPKETYGQLFAMLGIALLLSVRAALVPSPVVRTVVIGCMAVAALFVYQMSFRQAMDPALFDGLIFIGGAFVLATAVTSHVIYGLRREVRAALQLGQYTLTAKLGEGGMGAVYRAHHALLRREAAIKLIKPELLGQGERRQEAIGRFEREAMVTANLKSTHTVQLYDFGVSAEGAFYYVMELLDGINLETVIERYGPLPPERVVFLLRQVCDSLEEAHAVGLVHRDIKPANIFVCRYGIRFDVVKVLDFGLVSVGPQSSDGDAKLSAANFAGGTPAYVSPEVVTQSEPVDGRADIYALGCVAYWLLTGHAPFERNTVMATILAHVNETPAAPSSQCELAIPGALDALIVQCLAKDPADRPASVAALSRRLTSAVDADAWDQERAASWWELHQPEPENASTAGEPLVVPTVTRMLEAAP